MNSDFLYLWPFLHGNPGKLYAMTYQRPHWPLSFFPSGPGTPKGPVIAGSDAAWCAPPDTRQQFAPKCFYWFFLDRHPRMRAGLTFCLDSDSSMEGLTGKGRPGVGHCCLIAVSPHWPALQTSFLFLVPSSDNMRNASLRCWSNKNSLWKS